MMLRRVVWSFLVCGVLGFAARTPEPALARAQAALGRLPLRFEANEGQWRPDVRYGARTRGGALLLTNQGAALIGAGRRVDISMVKGNAAPRIEALEPLRARTNYFLGSRENWRQGVESFTRVAYRSVYPGIDVVYYGNGDQLEYDLVLRPGADPKAIRFQFHGADRVRLTPDGDLTVDSGGAQFVQKRPVIYQEDPATATRRPVAGRYELLAQGVVRLRLSAYDTSRPLVIDPVVTYSIFIGGSSTDVINAMTTDTRGLIYVAGYTQNFDLIPVGNAVQPNFSASKDAFVAVLNPNTIGGDTWVYFTFLGGGRDDVATAITLDVLGNINVTGTTTSSDFPLSGPSVQRTLGLSTTSTSAVFPTDAFVSIISMTDGLLYSTYYGGSNNETPHAIARDQAGFLYIFGTTQSGDLPVTPSAYQNVLWGPSDTFLAKLDPNTSTLIYATYLGGEADDDGRGMAVTPGGLVYFACSTYSPSFPFVGYVYRPFKPGVENIVIGVIDPTQSGPPSVVYSTYFGGSALDEVRALRLDANGKLWLTGWTMSRDFPVTPGAMQSVLTGTANAFVARVNPSAQPNAFVEYATFLGGTGTDVAYDMTLDAAGHVYVTGYTMSPDFPVKGAVQPQYGNGIDAFLVEFDPAVTGRDALLFGTYLGGVGTHVGQAVVLGPNASIYLAGYTTSDWHLPVPLNIYSGGGSDGFVAVLK